MAQRIEDVIQSKARVDVRLDGVTFNAFTPDGEKAGALTVSLSDLVERKDHHGLLLLGVFMQLATLNRRLDEQEQRASSQDQGDHIEKTIGQVMRVMQEAGIAPGGAPGHVRRVSGDQEG